MKNQSHVIFPTNNIIINLLAAASDMLLYTVGLLYSSSTYESMLNKIKLEELIKTNLIALNFGEIYLLIVYFYETVSISNSHIHK